LQDVVVRNGVIIAPTELEAAIGDHPDVLEAAVVARPGRGPQVQAQVNLQVRAQMPGQPQGAGLPQGQGQEPQVVAFVQPHPGATVDHGAVHELVANNLDAAKQPDAVNVVPQLVRNTMLKPAVAALRQTT
jgi:acyl-coenzyme A synthetase/AMP-(fatty) acid ligase